MDHNNKIEELQKKTSFSEDKTKKITCCPHCGSTEGFYTRSDYIGVPYMMGFNGEEKYNFEMYDNALGYKKHRYAYCIDCDEVICTANRIMKQIK